MDKFGMRNSKKFMSFLFLSITSLYACDPGTDEAILAAELDDDEVLAVEDVEQDEAADLDPEHTFDISQGGGVQAPFFTLLTVNGSGRTDSVPKGGADYYRFAMTKGLTYTVKMNYNPWGGDYSKDPDLYTHNSSSISIVKPNYLCRPFLGPGKSEKCSFVAPWTGTNYAMVHGATDAAYVIYVTSP